MRGFGTSAALVPPSLLQAEEAAVSTDNLKVLLTELNVTEVVGACSDSLLVLPIWWVYSLALPTITHVTRCGRRHVLVTCCKAWGALEPVGTGAHEAALRRLLWKSGKRQSTSQLQVQHASIGYAHSVTRPAGGRVPAQKKGYACREGLAVADVVW